jgi:hypothetical protein
MGSVLGIFYFQSRNILGPIIMHGFWDWVLSVWVLDVRVHDSYFELGYLQEILWLLALIPMALVILYFINIAYSAFWKGERPDASFGLGPVRFLSRIADKMGSNVGRTSMMKIFKRMDSSMFNIKTRIMRSVLSVVIISLFTMLLTTPGAVILETSQNLDVDLNLDDVGTSIYSYSVGIYIREGEAEILDLSVNESWLVSYIKITIFWADESPPGFRFTNLPDTFSSSLMIDMEEPDLQGPTDSGSLLHNWITPVGNLTKRDAALRITCEDAGDIVPIIDPFGLRRRNDEGNDVTISVQIEYIALID